jgi:transcriptional regulator with XRE-family HTH domain
MATSTPIAPAFGLLLKQRRYELGIPLRALARACGVWPFNLTYYESGRAKRLPPPDLLTALADALDTPVADLMAAAMAPAQAVTK